MNGLKLIRTICNYSQANLAEKLGVTRQAVNMWEHSKKPIPDSRKAEICELLGIEKAEWLDEIDEDTMDIIRTHKLYRKNENGLEHYHFSPTDDEYCGNGVIINNNDVFSIDDRCEMKRMKFKELLSEIYDYIENTRPETKNSMERIHRYNTADRLIGDVFEAWCTAMKQRPDLKMVYVHSLFAALDAVSVSFDIITEEEFLNSADPSSELYDTRNLTLNVSKQIRDYIEFATDAIDNKKAMK